MERGVKHRTIRSDLFEGADQSGWKILHQILRFIRRSSFMGHINKNKCWGLKWSKGENDADGFSLFKLSEYTHISVHSLTWSPSPLRRVSERWTCRFIDTFSYCWIFRIAHSRRTKIRGDVKLWETVECKRLQGLYHSLCSINVFNHQIQHESLSRTQHHLQPD